MQEWFLLFNEYLLEYPILEEIWRYSSLLLFPSCDNVPFLSECPTPDRSYQHSEKNYTAPTSPDAAPGPDPSMLSEDYPGKTQVTY